LRLVLRVFVLFFVLVFTGHFVMVPFNFTYLHCLQHSFFEHLFHLYYLNFIHWSKADNLSPYILKHKGKQYEFYFQNVKHRIRKNMNCNWFMTNFITHYCKYGITNPLSVWIRTLFGRRRAVYFPPKDTCSSPSRVTRDFKLINYFSHKSVKCLWNVYVISI